MSKLYGPVLLHWGGKPGKDILWGDVKYEGGQSRLMKIQRHTLYSVLLSKIYPVTGYSQDEFNLRLVCKWPVEGSNFISVDITDDNSTDLMLDLFDKVHIIQLFVEAVRVDSPSSTNITPLPTQASHGQHDPQERHLNSVNTQVQCAPCENVLPLPPRSTSTSSSQEHDKPSAAPIIMYGRRKRQLNSGHTQHKNVSYAPQQNKNSLEHNKPSSAANIERGPGKRLAYPQQNKDPLHGHNKSSTVANVNDKQNGEDNSDDDDEEQGSFNCNYNAQGLHVEEDGGAYLFEDLESILASLDDIPVVDARTGKGTWLFRSFPSKEDLQHEMQRWSLSRHVQYITKAPKPDVLIFKCIQDGCKWRLRVSEKKFRSSCHWSATSYGEEHSCINPVHLKNHRQCSTTFICDYIMPVFRASFTMTAREIMELAKSEFRVNISYSKAYSARKRCLKLAKDSKPHTTPSKQYSPSLQSTSGDQLTYRQDEELIEDELSCDERNVRARTAET